MMNVYVPDTPLEAIGREKNLKIVPVHRVVNRHSPPKSVDTVR